MQLIMGLKGLKIGFFGALKLLPPAPHLCSLGGGEVGVKWSKLQKTFSEQKHKLIWGNKNKMSEEAKQITNKEKDEQSDKQIKKQKGNLPQLSFSM